MRKIVVAVVWAWLAYGLAQGGASPASTDPTACKQDPLPVVAVVDFRNTTGTYGTTVVGVEDAATARLMTLLVESRCVVVVERSELQQIIARQGMESMEPAALARAAGAGYVVTGVVTRATIAAPQVGLMGVRLGVTRAQVEVDVRLTDIITGEVVVAKMGEGNASSPNISLSAIGTTLSFSDPNVGPLLAEAANQAILDVVRAIRTLF
jgi:curli biogenesis system outer membrane secretion channel CsgG